MAWPVEPTDTVLYEEKELIADKNLTLRMIDGAKVEFIGEVDIFSDVDITGDLSVNGDTVLNGNLDVNGVVSIDNLDVSGDITTNDLTASGNVTAKHLEVHFDAATDVYSFQVKGIGDASPRLGYHYAGWLGLGGGGPGGPDCWFMRLGAGYMQVQAFIQFLSRIDVQGPLTAVSDFAHQGTNLGFYGSPWVTKPTGVTAVQALVNLGLLTSPVDELDGPLDHKGTTAGFYNTTPIAKPSGVTAAQALVNLGLLASPVAETIPVERRTIKAVTATTYAPVVADENQMITLSNAATITVTMPSNATQAFPVGAEVEFLWYGVGQPVFAAGGGATIVSRSGFLKASIRYGKVTAKKLATNEWLLSGDLVA